MATQVDGARRDMNIHEVVDDATLDVVLHTVHQVPTAHVEYLDVGQVPTHTNTQCSPGTYCPRCIS